MDERTYYIFVFTVVVHLNILSFLTNWYDKMQRMLVVWKSLLGFVGKHSSILRNDFKKLYKH